MHTPKLKPVDGQKFCHACQEWKPVEKFRARGKKRQRSSPCTACARARYKTRIAAEQKRLNSKRPVGYHVAKGLYYRYGITVEQFTQMYLAQGGRCAICPRTLSKDSPDKLNRPHVDHCHVSGAVRGLLCSTCNSGLGMFGDSTDLLDAAKAYLQQHPASQEQHAETTAKNIPATPAALVQMFPITNIIH